MSTMNSNLLYIPLKQSKPIDLSLEFSNIIRKDYFQAVSSFENDLQLIAGLRNQVTSIKEVSLSSLETLKEWYAYLLLIKRKFPDDSVDFGWYHSLTYGLSGPTSIQSLKYEQFNILFQLASVYSQLALKESRFTDDGLKKSCAYAQASAGCFQYILKLVHLERPNLLPVDFTVETLQCLQFLMLAQAQEIIWQKALLDGSMKDSVIAKLSIEVSNLYSRTLEQGNVSDFIKLEWINHLTVKKFHFKAAAYYRTSLTYQNQFKYGEQITYLRVASKDCDTALRSKKYVGSSVVEDLLGLNSIIKSALKLAEKDNNLLYFKNIPGENELSGIVGVSMVRSAVPDFIENPASQNFELFKDLLPYVVMQVTHAFNERIQTFIKEQFVAPVTNLNNSLTHFLSDRKLLSQIDSIQQPENVPESIAQHCKEMTSIGGTQYIEEKIEEIRLLALQSKAVADECFNRFKLESNEDEMLKQKFGTMGWNRRTSAEASHELFEKVQKLNNYLEQARAGDQFVVSKYQDMKPILDIYCAGYDALTKFIPNSKHTDLNSHTSNIVSDLRNLVNEAIALKDRRNAFLDELEIKTKDNNILPYVIEEFKARQNEVYDEMGNINELLFDNVYEAHISRLFSKELQHLPEFAQEQTNMCGQLELLNDRFVKEYENINNESQRKRQEVLQKLEAVYSNFGELVSNLKEGSSFYNDFIVKSNGVLKECEEFLYQRRLEGRELEAKLTRRYQHAQDENEEIDPKDYDVGSSYSDSNKTVPLVSPASRSISKGFDF